MTAGRKAQARGKSGHRRAGRWGDPGGESRRKVAQKGDRRQRFSGDAEGKGEKVGSEPTSVVATRRLAKPRQVQGKQVPPAGGPPRDRVAAQMGGHHKQNPAYRPAKETPANAGVSIWACITRASRGRHGYLGASHFRGLRAVQMLQLSGDEPVAVRGDRPASTDVFTEGGRERG